MRKQKVCSSEPSPLRSSPVPRCSRLRPSLQTAGILAPDLPAAQRRNPERPPAADVAARTPRRRHPGRTGGKLKELVLLAQEQGYLTFNDINDALPDHLVSPEIMDDLYVKLRNFEIEIVDQAEVDRVRQPEAEEDEKARLDVLDDPVRMYSSKWGRCPC